jgi:hypothetical protein
MEASVMQVQVLQNCLNIFSLDTGLKVNFSKSCLVPIICHDQTVQDLTSLLGCKLGQLPFTYLGLPMGTTKPTIQDLAPLVSKCQRRLNACSRFLTQAGRVLYVNSALSALSALPTFYMCSMKLQKTLIKTLDRGRIHSVWAKKESDKVQSLAAWELVCKPKDKGGLGIINLELQNDALLLKQLYKFYNKAAIPWVDLVRYAHYSDDVPHASKKVGSFWWRDIWSLSWQFRGVSGNGSTILFWKDRWSDNGLLAEHFPMLFSFAQDPDISLQKVINLDTELHNLFYLPLSHMAFQELHNVSDMVLAVRHNENQVAIDDAWIFNYNAGVYSSASFYKLMFNILQVEPVFPKLWKCKCVPNMKVFTWLLLMDRLKTQDMMLRRHWHLQSGALYVMCSLGSLETRDHLFLECPFAKRCWDFYKITWKSGDSMSDIFMNAKIYFGGPNFFEITIYAAWNIRKERNGFIFEDKRTSFASWKVKFLGDLQTTCYRVKKTKVESLKACIASLG